MLLMVHRNKKTKHGCSTIGREYIRRQWEEAHAKLMANYIVDRPVFPKRYFRHRFRMSIDLFKHIAESVKLHDKFFEQKRNCERAHFISLKFCVLVNNTRIHFT